MGSYHGKAGFAEFSHTRSIVDKKTWLDPAHALPALHRAEGQMVRMFLK